MHDAFADADALDIFLFLLFFFSGCVVGDGGFVVFSVFFCY